MEEIGQRLRTARESREISLETAETETRIRRKYLEALESGHDADLPGEVYLKGFLRTYGNYLGLDGPALVDRYKESKEPRRPLQQNAATVEAPQGQATDAVTRFAKLAGLTAQERRQREEATRPKATGGQTHTRRLGPQISARSVTTVVVAVTMAVAIGYLGWLIALQFGAKPGSKTTTPTPPPVATAKQPEPVTTPPPVVPELPKVTMTRSAGQDVLFAVPAKEIAVRLEFTKGERVWMRAYVDDQQVYDGFPTEPLEYKGSRVRLHMGNMIGVSLVVNGQRFEKPLDRGPYMLIFTGQP